MNKHLHLLADHILPASEFYLSTGPSEMFSIKYDLHVEKPEVVEKIALWKIHEIVDFPYTHNLSIYQFVFGSDSSAANN